MRILLLSAWFPIPPSNGSRLRVNHLLRALVPHHEVDYLGFADQADVDPTALRDLCRSVQVLPRPPFDPSTWRSRAAWLTARPRSLVATFSPPMAAAITRAAARCDAIVASQITCAAYAPWFGNTPALFEELELGALHDQLAEGTTLSRLRARLMLAKLGRYLRGLLPSFGAVTVASDAERRLVALLVGHDRGVQVLPNAVVARDYAAGVPPQPDTLLFTGSLRYRPNYDGMRWFIAEVWPRVRRVRPAARLLITGDHAGLSLPDAGGVERTGFVDDVRPLLSGAWLALAPLFAGGGTRLKILEAMAAGTPVVSTHKGAEGLLVKDGRELLIADDPAGFAAHVLALLGDPAMRERLAAAARELVRQRYDWDVVGPRFESLVREVAGRA